MPCTKATRLNNKAGLKVNLTPLRFVSTDVFNVLNKLTTIIGGASAAIVR